MTAWFVPPIVIPISPAILAAIMALSKCRYEKQTED